MVIGTKANVKIKWSSVVDASYTYESNSNKQFVETYFDNLTARVNGKHYWIFGLNGKLFKAKSRSHKDALQRASNKLVKMVLVNL